MDFPFYKKELSEPPAKPVKLPASRPTSEIRPETYMPDKDLVDAVNVALLLGQPLLLTGEPGTGKTHLAYHVAWQFGLGKVLKFDTKSEHKAQDLFYIYDALRHFHAIQIAQANQQQQSPNAKDYLEYTALGKAIILANPVEKVEAFLPKNFNHPGKPKRSVVLIDEIDKAPRDFPNDILNEIEHSYFRVPELGINDKIEVTDAQFKPILILTSNSEKHLPAAFLRRCVYYNIPFPTEDLLRQIIEKRLDHMTHQGNEFLDDALYLFSELRNQLKEKPATAKLLNWLMTLHQMFKGPNTAQYHYPDDLVRTLSTLVTNNDDQEMAQGIFKDWLETKKPS